MSTLSLVKKHVCRFAGLLLLLLAPLLHAAEAPPPASEILRQVRASQAAQHVALNGQLRTGGKKLPFQLLIDGATVRYQFTTSPPLTMVLRLAEKEARLTEVTGEGAERVTGRKWDDLVQGSDISYEDLSLRFLYWSSARVEGEARMLMQGCWVVIVQPPGGSDSQYSQVKLWIEKDSGALLQAEALDRAGRFARRFKVISGQKIAGGWYLKQLRIEAPGGGKKDSSPTYLEIQKPE